MESKLAKSQIMENKMISIVVLTLIISILPDIIIMKLIGSVPSWLPFAKLTILIGAGIFSRYVKSIEQLSNYIIVLGAIIIMQILTKFIETTSLWQSIFDVNSFVGNFGGAILLKFIGIIPIIGVLVFTFKSRKEVYLCKGDLSIKADEISWIGINKNMISWGKLSLISGILISLGTIFLTILTVTGSSATVRIDKLLGYLPIIVIFALVNSFCEGIVFRSAILGSLKTLLTKNQTILTAGMFFGIAHYYGAPSGIIGVMMSGLLGWYMCRSMYETKGFVSSWIIHFMQDIVIFSTIILIGSFY